ncbi:MAG: N(4)-(beta-N-acetylglucosaminyl)-L-asparaginase [bacterium]|nr:N(4)-(beta-N-acetylglucosaminyl)-L-asparaginase [bacterium]
MTTRRQFLIGAAASVATLSSGSHAFSQGNGRRPLVISTWSHGLASNQKAWDILEQGGRALDAVEQGVQVAEADPEVSSVGYGGRPDREGHVTLDSCIMDEKGNAGSVAFLQNFKHPIAVARKVMEETPHVMIVGQGARQFALSQGFREEDLLTEESRKEWQHWLKTAEYSPWKPANDPNHDTISMLAVDQAGDLSGSCTTSGLAYKMHGRVGDSPIIGAALFVDNDVGAACATGVGEEVMKTVGSFLIVELMRQGMSAKEACREGVLRIVKKNPDWKNTQVGYLALGRNGDVGAYAIHPGFQYAVHDGQQNLLLDADNYLEE